jgi:hypothetical protein
VYRDISYENCFWKEQTLIFENRKNPLKLNKTYINPTTGEKILTTSNETIEERVTRIEKMSKTKKGKFNSNGHLGLKHSDETKQKMRETRAKINYRHSEETKQKMRGRVVSEETKQKMRKPRGPMPEWQREIYRQKAAQGWEVRRQKYGEKGRSK